MLVRTQKLLSTSLVYILACSGPPPAAGSTDATSGSESPSVAASQSCSYVPTTSGCRWLKPARATGSGIYQDFVFAKAFDGNRCTNWNSGGFPPQLIDLEFDAAIDINAIEFVPNTKPDSQVKIEIAWSIDGQTWTPLQLVTNYVQNDVPFTVRLVQSVHARFIRVKSLESQSWIAWHELLPLYCEAP